jgi:hypothetical protein
MKSGDLARAADELASAITLARAQELAWEEAQILRATAELARLEGRDADADDALHEAERLMQRVDATS